MDLFVLGYGRDAMPRRVGLLAERQQERRHVQSMSYDRPATRSSCIEILEDVKGAPVFTWFDLLVGAGERSAAGDSRPSNRKVRVPGANARGS